LGNKKHGLEYSKKAVSKAYLFPESRFKFKVPQLIRLWKGRLGTMKSMILGYARVSTDEQNLDRQIDALNKYGVDVLFNEKMSGKKRERPELNKLIERMSVGDTVVIESLSRLGRSTKDLIELMELFSVRGVNLVSLKESIDTNSSTGKLLFTLMSALAQFERDLISERTVEGLKAARERGRMGGRPKINGDQIKKAVKMYNTKQYSLKEIEEMTGVKKSTLYRNLGVYE
jgi:DNA invertase Pin-like site-specific DNA recombinase